MTRFVDPVPKYTDQSNAFMPYGLLYFFDSGTNDDKTTFADVNETIANTQPLILNGDGSVPNCFYTGSAKVVLVTNAGTPAAPVDGTQQWERDPVTSASLGAIGQAWNAVSIYDVDAVVIHNGILYISIINANQNNTPNSSPTAWTQFDLLKRFNTNETYAVDDPVIASNSTIYLSRVASNVGNDPISSPTQWRQPGQSLDGNMNPIAWGVFNFDTDTLISGDGCSIVRSSVGLAALTLDTATSAVLNTVPIVVGVGGIIGFTTTTTAVVSNFVGRDTKTIGTIANGTTSDTVTHAFGSDLTISSIQVTPTAALGSASYIYVSAVTSSDFTISCDVDPGTNITFSAMLNTTSFLKDVTDFQFVIYDTGT